MRPTPFLVELGEQIDRIVGLHPREHRRDLLVGAVLEQLPGARVLELLEQVGLELGVVVHGGEDLLSLRGGRRLDEVGDLRRVQAHELRVRHVQAHGRAHGR